MTDQTILFVDDEAHLRIAAEQTFELADLKIACFERAEAVLSRLEGGFDGILVTDIRMPGMDGVTLLARALAIDPDLPVIMVTGHADVDLAVRCIKEGAYDFLEKPCDPARLVASAKRALERRRLTLENRALRRAVASSNVIEAQLSGRSTAMQRVREAIGAIAATDADVLITGETGTGKEIAARAIHAASARAKGPFVQINCAALPETLIESELFGHEAGAFPGATRARFGKLEHARGGILCLDEIDLLPLPLQAKLLDVLHNRRVTRLGSNDAVALDIRVIAMAKVDLEEAVRLGRFRADLLYRLNVVTVALPPLSARREDIPGLFGVLADQVAARQGRAVPEIAPDQLSALAARDWPGNVRELRNAAERFVLGLGLGVSPASASGVSGSVSGPGNGSILRDPAASRATETLADHMMSYEKSLISAAIAAHDGRLKETYEALGLSRKTLYEKMQRHGLTREDFLPDPQRR